MVCNVVVTWLLFTDLTLFYPQDHDGSAPKEQYYLIKMMVQSFLKTSYVSLISSCALL